MALLTSQASLRSAPAQILEDGRLKAEPKCLRRAISQRLERQIGTRTSFKTREWLLSESESERISERERERERVRVSNVERKSGLERPSEYLLSSFFPQPVIMHSSAALTVAEPDRHIGRMLRRYWTFSVRYRMAISFSRLTLSN